MSLRILLILTALITLIQCSKDEELDPPVVVPEVEKPLPGFDYWLNTNEEWYFEIEDCINPPSCIWASFRYKVLRDSIFKINGKVVLGKILSEHRKNFGPIVVGHDSSETFSEIILFYNKEERILTRLDTIDGSEITHEVANFKISQDGFSCINQWDMSTLMIKEIDTIQIGNNYYTRYKTLDHMEMIEGISLGGSCNFYPPGKGIYYGWIELFNYSSDEYSYEWKK